ncbi:MAG: TonB-dependent receptor [Clostridium sp.]|nr:TonB-dependent receptor [Clostridium sp.]
MYHYLREAGKKLGGLTAVLLVFCLLTGLSFQAAAQSGGDTATGIVKDSTGEPLIGASVLVLGTTNGGATNFDGEFSIKNVKVGSTLRVSYVGCVPQDIKWQGTPLEVTLQDDSNTLDEVVVVGFGTQKKVNLTGAVSTVSSKELANRPVTSVAEALQGLAPGLDVLGSSLGGQLNGTQTMNIRGTGTIGSGSNVTPLVLVDGMEGDLNTLNPEDVENISILKDAAASSIYGSRAAGGVILVTTKKGKEGTVMVNYSDSFRWRHVIRMPKMMDSYTWANYMNRAMMNAGQSAWWTEDHLELLKQAQTDPSIPKMYENASGNWEVWDDTPILPLGNTDWLQEHFGQTSFGQEHNVSLTGGTEKYNYYFSGNLQTQEGILRHGDDNSKRYTINAKINIKITDWLTFGYSGRWSRNQYDAPSIIYGENASNVFYHNVMRYWPIIPTHDPNGYPVRESYIDALENGGRYKTTKDRMDHQFTFRVNPIEGLNLNAEFNYSSRHNYEKTYFLQTYAWNAAGNPVAWNPDNWPMGNTGSYVGESSTRANYFNPNIYGDYSRTFAEVHNFKIMLGYQSEWYHQDYFSAEREGIINNLPFLNTTTKNPGVDGGADTWTTAGIFGRLNYDYDGRYLVEGNLRYDASSRFRKGSRWTWSPSFSLGWNVANEKFWEDFVGVCNTLKVRYSWGKLGNQNTSSLYPTYATLGFNSNEYTGWLTGVTQGTSSMPGLIATSLTWEKNRTWDIGLDWGLFNNRFTGTIDYYNRKTIDMVGPGPVLPDVLGATSPKINNLAMTSKGWELTVTWRDRIGEFNYGITANLYDHTTTVDEYPNPTKNLGSYFAGRKLGDIYGFEAIGLAKTDAQMQEHLAAMDEAYTEFNGHAPANPNQGQNILGSGWTAGDVMFKDIDGDGRITQGEYLDGNSGDYKVIGNSTPRYNFGLNLDASWRGFDVRVFFQGTAKRDYYANDVVMFGATHSGKWQAIGLTEHLDYFRPADTTDPLGPNVDGYYPRLMFGGPNNVYSNTLYLQNAAYCRLKNVTIGYTLPQSLTRKAYIERCRIYVSGENLATITSFTKTGDPELIEAYNAGYGYGKVYPLSRVFSFGLNVTF